ncbi:MAG: hypothetical protein JRI59_09495, partial [Deltaproteobacteria bacterium]|nr:hypothetical protein [Deltaproteobacteria bacterium]
MPRLRSILLVLLMILLAGTFAVWRLLQADFFWRWAGTRLAAAVQERLNGTLTVKEIQGNPINGLIFREVALSSPQGEVLHLKSLEIRLSLWSVIKLSPVIGKLAVMEPRLTLVQGADGRWNVSRLARAGEKPAPPKAYGGISLPLRAVSLQQLLVVDGQITLTRAGQSTSFRNLDLNLAVHVARPFSPRMTVEISRGWAAVTTSQGRYALEVRLKAGKKRLQLSALSLQKDQERLLTVAGEAELAPHPGSLSFQGQLGPVRGRTLRQFWHKWPEDWDCRGTLQVRGT